MIRQRHLLAALAAAALAALPLASHAQVVNGDFGSGDLTGWQAAGDASVQPASGTDPGHLWLTTASVDFADDADSGLGIGARNASGTAAVAAGLPGGLEEASGLQIGALDPDAANGVVAFEGSVASQAFQAAAGSQLRFRWDLGTLDTFQPDTAWVVVDGQRTTLASLADAVLPGTDGNAWHTGWTWFDLTFAQGGLHTLAFGVADIGDFDGTSTLAIADVSVTAVPEAPTVALMAAGLALLGLRRRRA